MASKQGAILASIPPEGGANGIGHNPEAAPRIEASPRLRAAAASAVGVESKTATWFRGILVRRRCDSCGTRIHILGERDDRVFMQCPECLREYVFSQPAEEPSPIF